MFAGQHEFKRVIIYLKTITKNIKGYFLAVTLMNLT